MNSDIDNIDKLISPPGKETLWANIATQLKSLIFSQKLKPGSKMPTERELAQMFNVSRVVIKQALLALEHSGFIKTKIGSKGGAFITYDPCKAIQIFMEDSQKISQLELTHFNELRKALECTAVKLAIEKATSDDIDKLAQMAQDYGNPKNKKKHSEFNIIFHMAIAELSGNPLIRNILKPLLELVVRVPEISISDKFLHEADEDHQKIVEAIKAKNVDMAVKILEQNIERVR